MKVVEAKKPWRQNGPLRCRKPRIRWESAGVLFISTRMTYFSMTKGKTITLVVQMDDEQGLLSDLLHVVAVYRANILTIHQSIPVNGVATLTLSVEVRENTGNVSSMIEELEVLDGIHYVKILARE